MQLREAIQRIVKEIIPPPLVVGIVKDVDKDNNSCTVEIKGRPTRYDVRIKSIIGKNENGLVVFPTIGSKVILNTIEGKNEMSFIELFSEVEMYKLVAEKEIHLLSESVYIKGDSFGGLVKAKEISQKLNTIEKDINLFKDVVKVWKPNLSPGDGGLALQSLLSTWFATPLRLTKENDIENQHVKHG